ncbi:MAG: hypothetical protein P4L98_24040 [Ancalomicrobiaceae bacterium]|nr:hypothetical protein [Ancalomicrobiaceae bacterium]
MLFAALSAAAAGAAEDPRCTQLEAQFQSTAKPADVRRFMHNVTYRSYTAGHGNQIEYASADGRVHLWYPGNRIILTGHWKTEFRPISVPRLQIACNKPLLQLCFAYGENTYNPVTGQHGSGWECAPFAHFAAEHTDVVPGDPLGLATMAAPPFPLPRDNLTIAAILARMPH